MASVQQLLTVETVGTTITAEIVGWSRQDPRYGLLPPQDVIPSYETVAAALLEGWRVMQPPIRDDTNVVEWWLERLVEVQ